MQRQGSFSQVEYAGKKKQTRRDKFLAEMEVWCRGRGWWSACDRSIPTVSAVALRSGWSGCCGSTSCSSGTAGRRALKMRCTTARLCTACGIDLTRDPVPDATTLLKFRHWLERHELTRVLFEESGRCWKSAAC